MASPSTAESDSSVAPSMTFDPRAVRPVGILGTGIHVPERRLSNHDLERIVDTSDEWITTRTGMKERRTVGPDEAASDLAVPAARAALEAAGVDPTAVDLVLVATASPDYVCCPPTACIVQHAMGATRAAAFDVSGACSGFIAALQTAEGMLAAGRLETAVVIGVEALTKFVDYEERESCVLFGDGAGAVVLQAGATGGEILQVSLGADGSGEELIKMAGGGSRRPFSQEVLDERSAFIRLEGRQVFKFAVGAMDRVVRELLAVEGATVSDLALLVPHQANLRIIQAATDRLGIDPEKVVTNVDRYGNTSAASIPLALHEAIEAGRLARGDLVAMVAFGGGLTWGGALIRW